VDLPALLMGRTEDFVRGCSVLTDGCYIFGLGLALYQGHRLMVGRTLMLGRDTCKSGSVFEFYFGSLSGVMLVRHHKYVHSL